MVDAWKTQSEGQSITCNTTLYTTNLNMHACLPSHKRHLELIRVSFSNDVSLTRDRIVCQSKSVRSEPKFGAKGYAWASNYHHSEPQVHCQSIYAHLALSTPFSVPCFVSSFPHPTLALLFAASWS